MRPCCGVSRPRFGAQGPNAVPRPSLTLFLSSIAEVKQPSKRRRILTRQASYSLAIIVGEVAFMWPCYPPRVIALLVSYARADAGMLTWYCLVVPFPAWRTGRFMTPGIAGTPPCCSRRAAHISSAPESGATGSPAGHPAPGFSHDPRRLLVSFGLPEIALGLATLVPIRGRSSSQACAYFLSSSKSR